MTDVPYFRTIAALAQAPADDGELLRRFADTGDGPAFELIVRRHANMVWSVCRAAHPADLHTAEDAFQATFLALARTPSAVREKSAAGWLFGVARNVSRRAHKRSEVPLPIELSDREAIGGVEADEAAAVVTDEVGRLTSRLREPVLLCFYEGCTQEEAARRLGVPVGTVASRLARAKTRLHTRLTRRGVAPASVGAIATLTGAPASAVAVRASVSLVLGPAGAIPPRVQILTQGALATMSTFKQKLIVTAAACALLASGGASFALLAGGDGDGVPADKTPQKPLATTSRVRAAPAPPQPAPPPPAPEVGPIYAIVPVTTDLQRRLLGAGADKKLSALVLVNGDALFPEPTRINVASLAPKDIRASLVKYTARKERGVHFSVYYSSSAVNNRDGVDFVMFGVEGIGRWAGFGGSTSSNSFGVVGRGNDWDTLTGPLKAAAAVDEDEPAAGAGVARAYPVRTPLSRALTGKGASYVVDILPSLDPEKAVWLNDKEREEVRAAIAELKPAAGTKIDFHFELKKRDDTTEDRVKRLAGELAEPHGLIVGSMTTH